MPGAFRCFAERLARELRSPLMTVAALLAVGTAVAQPFSIPSGSMEPTLLVGDRIAASKYAYGYSKFSSPIGLMPDFHGRILTREPERGDVVVFRLPRDPSQDFVKRVIGLPGELVQMRGGDLYINGRLVARREIGSFTTALGDRATRWSETLPNGRSHEIITISPRLPLNDTAQFVVPDRHYFVMGDNRDNSIDSRVPADQDGVGFVPIENLVGRVDVVLLSITPFDGILSALRDVSALRVTRVMRSVE